MADPSVLGNASQSLQIFFRQSQGDLFRSCRSDDDIEIIKFLSELFYTVTAPKFMFCPVTLKIGQCRFLACHLSVPLSVLPAAVAVNFVYFR